MFFREKKCENHECLAEISNELEITTIPLKILMTDRNLIDVKIFFNYQRENRTIMCYSKLEESFKKKGIEY